MSLAVNLASFSLANSCFGGIFDRSPLGVDALKMNQILLYWIFKEQKNNIMQMDRYRKTTDKFPFKNQ
jgi:hypothetical protein